MTISWIRLVGRNGALQLWLCEIQSLGGEARRIYRGVMLGPDGVEEPAGTERDFETEAEGRLWLDQVDPLG